MELDELIRSTRPADVGSPPSVASLRSRVRRRRTRRAALASALAVALVGVVLVVSLDGRRHEDRVSVQPPRPTEPRRADDAPSDNGPTWSDVGAVPLPPGFGSVQMAVAGDLLVVAATSDSPVAGAGGLVVHALDPTTHVGMNLDFPRSGAPTLLAMDGWHDGVVLLTREEGVERLDRWEAGRWTSLALPTLPSGAQTVGLHVIGDRLVFVALSPPTREAVGLGDQESLWTSGDGRSWDGPTVSMETSTPSSFIIGDDRVLMVGSPFGKSPSASVGRFGTGPWQAVFGYPDGVLWPAEGGWVGDTAFACGPQLQVARFDCMSWTGGDRDVAAVDPPPVQPAHGQEGYDAGFRAFVDDGRLIVGAQAAGGGASQWDAYNPSTRQWSTVEQPPVSGLAAQAVTARTSSYVAFVDGRTVHVERFHSPASGLLVPSMTDLGSGMAARIPTDRWRVQPIDGGVSIAAPSTSTDGSGKQCPAERIEIRPLPSTQDAVPWPGTADLTVPTPPCTPRVVRTWFLGRAFELTVWNSAPERMGTTGELGMIVGSFRLRSG
ncbi:MAG: hypothetical protein U0Q22_05970 [Acidimicrobiales bacterium]